MTTRVWQYQNLWNGCVGAWSPSRQRWPASTLIDYSPNNNHGTLTSGPIWTLSQGAYALSFDGTDDYVEMIETGTLDLSSAITVSAWVYSTASSGFRPAVAKYDFGGTSNPNTSWYISATASGTIEFHVFSGTGSFSGRISSTVPVINTWYHVVGTWNGAGTTKLYVNGGSGGTDTSSGTVSSISINNITVKIGRAGNSASTSYFAGQIDDLRIYNRALNPSEITLLSRRRGIADDITPRRSYRAAAVGGTRGDMLSLLGVS